MVAPHDRERRREQAAYGKSAVYDACGESYKKANQGKTGGRGGGSGKRKDQDGKGNKNRNTDRTSTQHRTNPPQQTDGSSTANNNSARTENSDDMISLPWVAILRKKGKPTGRRCGHMVGNIASKCGCAHQNMD